MSGPVEHRRAPVVLDGARGGTRTHTPPKGSGGLSPLRLPIPPPGPAETIAPAPKTAESRDVPGSSTAPRLGHTVVDRRQFARIIDRQPQRRPSPICLRPRQPIGSHHTLDHVGDHRRPRAPFQLDSDRGHTPTEPERAMHIRQPWRRPKPGHHKGAQTSRLPEGTGRGSKSKTRCFHRSPLCQWGVTVHWLWATSQPPRGCHGGVRRSGGGSKAGAQPGAAGGVGRCLLYTSPSPRDRG